MRFIEIGILFVGLIAVAAAIPQISLPKDLFTPKKIRNMVELGRYHGYLIEEHKVTTQDGYILSTYRVPPGKHCGSKTDKKPVLIVHGILCSSFEYIFRGPKQSLVYKLANDCYDVWMLNSRGNSVSREHVNLTTSDPKFWDFTWHEMGMYDVPAVVDHMLKITNETSIHYLGHSQGTTEFFVFASSLPEYRRKIVSAHLMAPVAYFNYMNNPIAQIAAEFSELIELIIDSVHIYDLDFIMEIGRYLGHKYCRDDEQPEFSDLCAIFMFSIMGVDQPQMNMTSFYEFFENFPSGAGTKQLYHFAQTIKNHNFSQYDYGAEKNLELYGSPVPPAYNISSIDIPTVVYYADNDVLVSVKEVENLLPKLPSLVEAYEIPYSSFTHLDYMIATDADILLWSKVIEMIGKLQ